MKLDLWQIISPTIEILFKSGIIFWLSGLLIFGMVLGYLFDDESTFLRKKHWLIGGLTYRIILFFIILVSLSLFGLKIADNVIFLIFSIAAFKLTGWFLRLIRAWRY